MANARSILNRKGFFAASILLAMPIALLFFQPGPSVGVAQGGFESALFDVVPDSAALSTLPDPGATFLLTGKIYPFRTVNQATCAPVTVEALGTWRAWGQIAEGGKLVISQSLQLDRFNGLIEGQGPTGAVISNEGPAPAIPGTTGPPFTGPTEVISVTGGAGTYRGASGEFQIRPYCQSQTDITRPFRYDRPFCILLQETPRRRGANR